MFHRCAGKNLTPLNDNLRALSPNSITPTGKFRWKSQSRRNGIWAVLRTTGSAKKLALVSAFLRWTWKCPSTNAYPVDRQAIRKHWISIKHSCRGRGVQRQSPGRRHTPFKVLRIARVKIKNIDKFLLKSDSTYVMAWMKEQIKKKKKVKVGV